MQTKKHILKETEMNLFLKKITLFTEKAQRFFAPLRCKNSLLFLRITKNTAQVYLQ